MNIKLREELDKRSGSAKLAADVDLHVHTVFSDGNSTAEEMVLSAIDRGISILGFSEHSHIPGEDWCMTPETEIQYRREIASLKGKYADRIQIYCGIEQDILSGAADPYYDYVIGSAHAIVTGGQVVWSDYDRETVERAVREHFGGDHYAFAEAYYDNLSSVDAVTGCDIVGHVDIITKFNEGNVLFDTSHPRYRKAWKKAVDSLTGKGLIFEINTGAISRGYRTSPYPSEEILSYILSKGEQVVLSSDAHDRTAVAFGFDRWQDLKDFTLT